MNRRCFSAFIVSKDKDNHEIFEEICGENYKKVETEAEKRIEGHPELCFWIEETTDKYMDIEEDSDD